tara:strand:- start:18046 stop:18339 length:294 start_codon:yes stop_codon:yes gene_type:complete
MIMQELPFGGFRVRQWRGSGICVWGEAELPLDGGTGATSNNNERLLIVELRPILRESRFACNQVWNSTTGPSAWRSPTIIKQAILILQSEESIALRP